MAAGDVVSPAWVVPTCVEVRDLALLALRGMGERDVCGETHWYACRGMLAVIGWVRGLLPAPVTGRPEGPVSWPHALSEKTIAMGVWANLPPDLYPVLCRDEGVEYLRPRAVHPDFATGVSATLRWLVGEAQDAPLVLPIREPNGSLVTAARIYTALVSGESDGTPACLARLRAQADQVAAQTRELAWQVEDTADRWRAARR